MFPLSRRLALPSSATPFAVALVLLLAVPLRAQDPAAPLPDSTWDPDVRPGDLIALTVPADPDLNGGFRVNADWVVSFPLIGDMYVRGETQRSLRLRVREEMGRVIRSPGIDVLVQKRVRVLGLVGLPGLYNAEPTMTVADVLALAGGRLPEAKQDELQLLRGGEVLLENMNEHRSVSDLRLLTGDEIYVPQRSWLSRNLAAVATSVFGAVTVIAVTLAGN